MGYTGVTLTSVFLSILLHRSWERIVWRHPSVDKDSGTFLKKLLAQFISHLAFNLRASVSWPIYPYGVCLLTPIRFRVHHVNFGSVVAKYLANNGVSRIKKNYGESLLIVAFLPSILALWCPNILPKMGFPSLKKQLNWFDIWHSSFWGVFLDPYLILCSYIQLQLCDA